MLNAIINNNINEIISLLNLYKVKRAYAFGSVCTDKFNDESDIDLLIAFNDGLNPLEYGDNYFLLVDALEKLFMRHVDLVTEPTLRNPYFIKSVNLTKTPIYERRD
jgi:predicted nucleotidyltransferase